MSHTKHLNVQQERKVASCRCDAEWAVKVSHEGRGLWQSVVHTIAALHSFLERFQTTCSSEKSLKKKNKNNKMNPGRTSAVTHMPAVWEPAKPRDHIQTEAHERTFRGPNCFRNKCKDLHGECILTALRLCRIMLTTSSQVMHLCRNHSAL